MTLYHVTTAKAVRMLGGIIDKGILPLRRPNWERAGGGIYGTPGFIYCFEDRLDALRWAGIMDWELNKQSGSGKIAVVRFSDDVGLWEEDDADPLRRVGSKGRWLKKLGSVKAESVHAYELVDSEKLRFYIENV
jgi:hypothetical protein